jgi:hypothetical protein
MQYQAHVVHHIRGRMRLKVKTAKNRPHALEQIRTALSEVSGVSSASANPLTGSILLHYQPMPPERFLEHLAERGEQTGLFALVDSQASDPNQAMQEIDKKSTDFSSHSLAAVLIIDEIRKANLEVKKASDNTIDLKILAPLGVAVASALTIASEAATPLWITLAMFSFQSFVSLHPHVSTLQQTETIQQKSLGALP